MARTVMPLDMRLTVKFPCRRASILGATAFWIDSINVNLSPRQAVLATIGDGDRRQPAADLAGARRVAEPAGCGLSRADRARQSALCRDRGRARSALESPHPAGSATRRAPA